MKEPMAIERAAVIGAGVMGAAIAAHLANAGIPTLLLDLKPDALTDEEAAAGLTLDDPRVALRNVKRGFDGALKAKPAALYNLRASQLITLGNLDDDLEQLEHVDWVIEAVIENLEIKQDLLARISPYLGLRTILTTNTSGLSIADLSEAIPAGVRPRFFATHFFNPPRYLELLEFVAAPETDPALIEAVAEFAESRLGKGVVVAKDTPNFIANRLGVFSLMHAMHTMLSSGLTVADVDALTGPAIGRAKSATFRTADVVGLDTLVYVAQGMADRLEEDPQRDTLYPPAVVDQLVEAGRLGQKSGAGFYKKEGRSISMVDPSTLEYVERNSPSFPCLAQAASEPDLASRIRGLFHADDAGGRFLRSNLAATIAYAAQCVPEISDRLPSIDDAMRWGFGWELGPFELFDAIGSEAVLAALDELEIATPPLLAKLAEKKQPAYKSIGHETVCFDPVAGKHDLVPTNPRRLSLAGRTIVEQLDDARLVDLGENVLALQFTSKRNTITPAWIDSASRAVDRAERDFRGLVLGSDANDFCVGANLQLVLDAVKAGQFDTVDSIVQDFQALTQRFRGARRPVVIAPRGLVLGGGAELVLAGGRVRSAAECYIGLVEVGAGLIPAGGGCTALLRRLDESVPDVAADLFPYVRRIFETVGMARVATSAAEARELGYLRPGDGISLNRHHVLADARDTVLAMELEGYTPERPRTDIRVLGRDAFATISSALDNMLEGRMVTEYDSVVGRRLAWVLCGGELSAPSKVSEEYLLTLERTAFVELCRDERTQARMAHILETGKPLRN